VGFPGGSLDPGESEKEAALRELHEESGLLISEQDLISALTPLYIPPSNFIVYPYVGLINKEPTWRFDQEEVKRGIEVPLKELLKPNNLKEQTVKMSGSGMNIKVKSFPFGNEVVWGATAMILSECKEILKNLAE
jgi:8-oxo-dGTP pyrophosphatase MutT (NUDIX family)